MPPQVDVHYYPTATSHTGISLIVGYELLSSGTEFQYDEHGVALVIDMTPIGIDFLRPLKLNINGDLPFRALTSPLHK